ncbi:HAD family hydrolase [Rossellomorea vietnamensis]|uniref:HAD family hydrolase n=1 Tax=Rossellomorea vietnamensis TaxID=218284 RepID=A0A5D4NGY6_9BACI|nr:HAD family hydrolase [Rossellomorea vietnamensis]TYS13505.1 HAD family hydrolase [Rossellomorea vietnamensis]
MSIKAFFLDFYGTVVHEDGEIISKICNQIKDNSKTEATLTEIGGFWWKEFSNLFQESYGETFRTQRVLETISLKNTLSNFGSTLDENILSELMYNHWMQPSIFDDSLEFFKQNNVPVYILSNIDNFDVNTAIAYHKLKVKEVITSEDVQSYKPRPEMFEKALKLCNLSKDEVLHVGDSLSSDVSGAMNVGIKSVWINRNNKEFKGKDEPNYTINKLDELLKFEMLVKN